MARYWNIKKPTDYLEVETDSDTIKLTIQHPDGSKEIELKSQQVLELILELNQWAATAHLKKRC
jgi:hypothetical protein